MVMVVVVRVRDSEKGGVSDLRAGELNHRASRQQRPRRRSFRVDWPVLTGLVRFFVFSRVGVQGESGGGRTCRVF